MSRKAKKQSSETVTWTIRNVPDDIDQALRAKAKREKRTLTSVVAEAMEDGFVKLGWLKPGERIRPR